LKTSSATGNRFTSIEQLAELNSVDKRQHGYLPVYSFIFEPLRFEPLHILEIGFRRGRGARWLAEYFHRSRVYTLDIAAEEERHYLDIFPQDLKDRIILMQCDQGDKSSLDITMDLISRKKHYKPFDIVIDDGSHQPAHQLLSFQTIWPMVNPSGYYVIEDMHPFYENGAHPTVEYFKREADKLNKMGDIYDTSYPVSEFEWIMFTLNRIVLRKKIV